uniref:Uncharacterized protein n=1 Tax=Zea mays TaxID=4577 RepID=C4IZ31_MAIZE|nr:unknown [Zea mays]
MFAKQTDMKSTKESMEPIKESKEYKINWFAKTKFVPMSCGENMWQLRSTSMAERRALECATYLQTYVKYVGH